MGFAAKNGQFQNYKDIRNCLYFHKMFCRFWVQKY